MQFNMLIHETLISVHSPYRGKVRRVKVLNQSERDINVEVTLDVRSGRQGDRYLSKIFDDELISKTNIITIFGN